MFRVLYLLNRYLINLIASLITTIIVLNTPFLRYVFQLLFSILFGTVSVTGTLLTLFIFILFSLLATLLDNSQIGPAIATALAILVSVFNSPMIYLIISVLKERHIASSVTKLISQITAGLQITTDMYTIFILITVVSVALLIYSRFADSLYLFSDIASLVINETEVDRASFRYLTLFGIMLIIALFMGIGLYITLSSWLIIGSSIMLKLLGILILITGILSLIMCYVLILQRRAS